MTAPDEERVHTVDVGYVHVGNGDGECAENCPHPSHGDQGWSDRDEAVAALNDGRLALARAIGLLEAHWEVCADPFPDASLRRALDRMEAAASHGDQP